MGIDVCNVCNDKFARYKCPKCLDVMYCSVTCHKIHRENCSPSDELEREREKEKHRQEKRKRRKENSEAWAAQYGGTEEPHTMLSRAQLHAIALDPRVKDEVKTKELQDLLKVVDGSRSRLDALETAMHNVPEFRSFVDNLLRVIWMNADE